MKKNGVRVKVVGFLCSLAMVGTLWAGCSANTYATPSTWVDNDGDEGTFPWGESFKVTTQSTSQSTTNNGGDGTKQDNFTTTSNTTSNITSNIISNATGEVVKPSRGKVVKANTKKLSAKKLTFTIKRLKGVKGYQVQISKAKNFKTKKNVIVSKFVKKVKVTVTSKKLVNKKKLYVRVRAYKLDGKTKVYGNWSKISKVKVK